ncbi:synaptopodin [Notechis scutatus]|uniref:Synaptopodin n=1 Tax=Notechis scutatus TaxID=8663 RepID=A0A6J1VC84_9SAUR|nr:synaptopodin [Notechis scutatus]
MLKTTLRPSCLQPQPNCAGPSRVDPNPHIIKNSKADPAEGKSCLARLQGTGNDSSHGEQERKESARENLQKEPWRANGNVLPHKSNDKRPWSNEKGDSPWPVSDGMDSGINNRDHQSQEWKVVKVKRVLLSLADEPRKANISRSASLSETELKEAKERSQRIVAQLTNPPSSNSKGVLLFHRRKQRVNAFTLGAPKPTNTERGAAEKDPKAVTQPCTLSHGEESHLKQTPKPNKKLNASFCLKNFGRWGQKVTMEKYEEELGVEHPLDNAQSLPWNKEKSDMILYSTNTTSSKDIPEEEFQQIPLSVYLKENMTTSTNGIHEPLTEFGKMPMVEQGPIMGNTENIPAKTEDEATPNIEKKDTILEKELYLLHMDQENNVLDKEPYLPIGSEKNNNIPDKDLYAAVIDMENNIVFNKTLNEPVIDRKENGEVPYMEQDELVTENENIFPTADTGKATDVCFNEASAQNHRQYCEVRLTLSKPQPVKNRTARPFGTQSLAKILSSAEKSPVAEIPPPPTYAETFSSPPPVTRVRSPPAYSALYPSQEQKILVPPEIRSKDSSPGPQFREDKAPPPDKTGILEESAARRTPKKSMFTFVEKPKVGPNPDLLNLVQTSDNKKKQKGQGGAVPEDESFALGADASNFLTEDRSLHGPTQSLGNPPPEWSSCLRSPKIQPKPKISSNQSLSEAKGKGAELFAKRQSRMQKYVIEAPSHPDIARSPSPTMSLPPSWKYTSETHLSPVAFQPTLKSPSRSPKGPPVSFYNSNLTESQLSKKGISKQQPYQLQSPLFVRSPVKEPMRSVVPEGGYMRQASSSTSPLASSPLLYPPVQPSPSRTLPGLFAPLPGNMFPFQKIRANAETSPEAPFDYSSKILSPRAKGVFQAPRPSYSTKNAGIEPQERKASLPASPTWTPQLIRRPSSSTEGWMSPAQTPESEDGLVEAFRAAHVMTPPPPMSPSWSERSLSPFRQEIDQKSSRQMQVLLARNIINAARRKSSSPKLSGVENFRPFTPPVTCPNVSSTGGSPKNRSTHSPSPLQSPKPTRMDGYRCASLPVSAAPPQASASSNNSPRLLGIKSPSPLQSPKAGRMNGNKCFMLPTRTGAPQFVVSTNHNGPSIMGTHFESRKDPEPTIMDSHKAFSLPANTSGISHTSSKNLDASSPTLQSPMMTTWSSVKRSTSMSPTNSEASVDSDCSGVKSPSIRSFNICPRGWNGSLRLKRGSLPSEASCTS